ncbi:hypothetical protein SAMN06295912_10162 [Sphingomonas laterariae]|uniref:Lipoprotein n=1 Tax=Edaphosphingomonas laterariae TaxID=861865 RepID=A0A239BC27_9SPHN|nr:hypothetical protein [Sphingomonas laterariae]SNS05517.1 hypothetical protein SAMN06295912_10162 [Sphingomonas laterariae]
MFHPKTIAISFVALALAGCATNAEFDETGGIKSVRSSCPAVAIPVHTADVTLFDPAGSRDARAIDVVATITNLRNTCVQQGDRIVTTATFDIQARRTNTSGAREVVLPYFATVTRGGTQIVSKQLSRVALRFADGQSSATATGGGNADIAASAATLPPEIEEQVTRRRKPGDPDAATDPLADPAVRSALRQASFELLVGFQLTQDQLAYNATR